MPFDLTRLKSPIKVHTNCTVIDVSSGAFPRYIEVRMPGPDGARRGALWNGTPALANDDVVICHEIPNSPVLLIASLDASEDASTNQVKVTKLVSPDLATDPVISADNNGDVTLAGTGNLIVPDDIVHAGDSDTLISFETDRFQFDVAGQTNLDVQQGVVTINADDADVDTNIRGDTEANLFYVNAGLDAIGVKQNDPSYDFDVAGDVGADGDFYPGGDPAGLFQRLPNSFETPTDHFSSFSGYTWASYTGFVTPANISTGVLESHVRIANTAVEGQGRAFAYTGSFSSDIRCRIVPGQINVRGGLRMDDGTNDNYAEVWISVLSSDNGVSGMIGLYTRYSVATAVTGPTQQWNTTLYPIQYVKLVLTRSGDNVFAYAMADSPTTSLIATMTITGWTPARSGIYHEHVGTTYANARSNLFDWFYEA